MNARKLRSKNYKEIVEVLIPVRFYWGNGGFDGLGFGPLNECTAWESKIIRRTLDQMSYLCNCARVIQYMDDNHHEQLMDLLGKMDAEVNNIPQAFLDAFGDEL